MPQRVRRRKRRSKRYLIWSSHITPLGSVAKKSALPLEEHALEQCVADPSCRGHGVAPPDPVVVLLHDPKREKPVKGGPGHQCQLLGILVLGADPAGGDHVGAGLLEERVRALARVGAANPS